MHEHVLVVDNWYKAVTPNPTRCENCQKGLAQSTFYSNWIDKSSNWVDKSSNCLAMSALETYSHILDSVSRSVHLFDGFGSQHSDSSSIGRVVASIMPRSTVDRASMGMEQYSQRTIYPETTKF